MRRRGPKSKKLASGFSQEPVPYEPSAATTPKQQSVELGAGGRLVIPAPMRAALGMKVGDRLNVRLEGDELRICTYEVGIRRAQELARKFLPKNAVDEFLKWKRQEAAKERAEMDRWLKDE